MTRILVDPATIARLQQAQHVVELVDDNGQTLGHFVPNPGRALLRLEPLIDEEEMARREKQGGGRSLSEILADLEKRV